MLPVHAIRSTELLGEADEKSFGPADVAEPIRVFMPDYFADELRAAIAEPFQRLVDVVHGGQDGGRPERSPGIAVILDDRRREEKGEIEIAVLAGGAILFPSFLYLFAISKRAPALPRS